VDADVKEQLLEWSEQFAARLSAPVEVALEAPPAVEIQFVTCPHCDNPDVEVLNSTEAHVTSCPECGASFVPHVLESSAKAVVIAVTEDQI